MKHAKERARKVLDGMKRVTENRVRGAHDAQMVIVKGRAYIVYEANDVRPGEGWWPYVYCAMSVVEVQSGSTLAVEEIATPGRTFSNVQLKEGTCFVPRILIKDENTLRCFFVSMDVENRETESWYRDYDITQERFSDCIYPLWLETDASRVMLSPTPFHEGAKRQGFAGPMTQDGPYLFDADKVIDGRRYAAVNLYAGKLNALAEMSDELDCVRILSYIFEPQSEALSEAAIEKMPDGKWVAILRNDANNHNYRFATSADGVQWTAAEEWPVVQNGSNSKPLLHRFGDIYCMGWQEKPARSRFNIDVSADFEHWMRMFAFDDMDFSLQYPALYEWQGVLYICGTHCFPGCEGERRESIYFGRLCTMEELQRIAQSNR